MGACSGKARDVKSSESETLIESEADEERDEEGMAKRSVTDPVCLVIFLAYLAGMICCAVYGFQNGDIKKLTHGMDFSGQTCGVDSEVSQKPYLYWCGKSGGPEWQGVPLTLNLDMPICVSDCPTAKDEQSYCPDQGVPESKITGDQDKAYTVVTTMTFKVSAKPSYPTKAMGLKLCWPKIEGNETVQALLEEQLKSGPLAGPMQKLMASIADMQSAKYLLYSVIALGFVLSLLYLCFLKWVARPLVYITLALMVVLPLFAGVACFLTAYNVTGNQHYSPFFKALPYDQAKLWSQIVGGVFIAIALLFVILILCAKKSIDMCIGCIKAACECIFDMPTMLLEPIVGGILKIGIFFGCVYGLMWLVSSGDVAGGSVEYGGKKIVGLSRTVSVSEEERYMIFFYVFGILWIMAMCDGMQSFVIGYAVVLWYYKPIEGTNKPAPFLPCIRGFWNGLVYHLGSIAFGSLCIAVCDALRIICSAFAKQADASGNAVGACVGKCCICCVTCFKKCLQYITKNAYVDVAIRSSNFIPASLHTFKFIASEAAGISILSGAATLAQVGGVLSVTSLGAYVAFLCVDKVERWSDPYSPNYVQEPLVMVGVASFICFCISYLFMLVFDMAADTLLYTYADQKKRRPREVARFAPPTLASLVEDGK